MRNFILGLILTAGSLANAGAISGGGGKGVVCRDQSGNITWAKTLDLYEGKVLYNLPVQESTDPVSDQVRKALDVIPPHARGLIEAYAYGVNQNMQIVHGMDLQPIDDALVVAVPHGCQAEQLANYFDDKHILINGDIWDALSKTDQAALILHEAVYATARILGAKNSQRSRHIVASLFDPNTKWTDLEEGLPQERLYCVSKGTQFYAFQDADKTWQLQFTMLGGNWAMSKTTFAAGRGDFDLNEAKTFPVIQGEEKIGEKTMAAGYSQSSFENADIVTLTKIWEPLKNNKGENIPGYQTPRYYLNWRSSTYPDASMADQLINCSIVIH